MSTAPRRARIRVKGVKNNTLLPPAALPTDVVPPEPLPAGNPVVERALESAGRPLVVRASLNGKAVRRALKAIAEQGPKNVNVVLQGTLKPAAPGEPFLLEGAGLAVIIKSPKEGPPGGGPS